MKLHETISLGRAITNKHEIQFTRDILRLSTNIQNPNEDNSIHNISRSLPKFIPNDKVDEDAKKRCL